MDETATLREQDSPMNPVPVSEQPPHTGTVVAACSAVFAAQLALVLPAAINGEMQAGLQTTGSELTWITATFLVPIAMFSLSFGMLGDRFGRRKILSFGAAALTIGLLVSGISGSLHGLWVGQAIAGVGAAAMFPTSLASITALTPGAKQRARGLAAWTTALSTGALAAPPLSAALTEWSGFRWAFLGAAAFAALSLALMVALAHDSRSPEPRQFDIPGQVTIAAGLLALLFGVIEAAERGWTTARRRLVPRRRRPARCICIRRVAGRTPVAPAVSVSDPGVCCRCSGLRDRHVRLPGRCLCSLDPLGRDSARDGDPRRYPFRDHPGHHAIRLASAGASAAARRAARHARQRVGRDRLGRRLAHRDSGVEDRHRPDPGIPCPQRAGLRAAGVGAHRGGGQRRPGSHDRNGERHLQHDARSGSTPRAGHHRQHRPPPGPHILRPSP